MSRNRIDPKAFVVAWVGCETTDEVAIAMGITRQAASNYAWRLRKFGVKLDSKRKVDSRKVMVAELNALIRQQKAVLL